MKPLACFVRLACVLSCMGRSARFDARPEARIALIRANAAIVGRRAQLGTAVSRIGDIPSYLDTTALNVPLGSVYIDILLVGKKGATRRSLRGLRQRIPTIITGRAAIIEGSHHGFYGRRFQIRQFNGRTDTVRNQLRNRRGEDMPCMTTIQTITVRYSEPFLPFRGEVNRCEISQFVQVGEAVVIRAREWGGFLTFADI